MNQVFTKKKLAAALTLAFATGGAAVLAVAPVPGLVAAAQANEFADTTQATGTSAGVPIGVSSSAAVTGQTFSITETTGGAIGNGGMIKLTLTNGAKFKSGTIAVTGALAVKVGGGGTTSFNATDVDTDGSLRLFVTSPSAAGTGQTIQLSALTLDTSAMSIGQSIDVSISSASTATGLTTGQASRLANVSAGTVTLGTAPTAASVVSGASSGNLPSFTFSENLPGVVGTTSADISLTLKNGYSWTATPVLSASGGGVAVASSGNATLATNNTVANYSLTTASSTAAATFTMSNAGTVFVPAGSTQPIVATLTVKKSGATVFTGDVTLANVVTSGITASYINGTTGGTTAPTTYQTLYTGRIYSATALTDRIRVKETNGGALATGSTLSFELSSGATWTSDSAGTTLNSDTGTIGQYSETVDGFNLGTGNNKAITVSTSAKAKANMNVEAGGSDASAGDTQMSFSKLSTVGASTGDLTVTVSTNAMTSALTPIKLAEIKNATTSSVTGTMPTMLPGAAAASALPDIVITETAKGALAVGTLSILLPANVTFDNSAAPTVTVTDSTGTLTSIVTTPSTAHYVANAAGTANSVYNVALTTASTTNPYTITIKGLKVKAGSAANAGDMSIKVIGNASAVTAAPAAAVDETTNAGNVGAKPTAVSIKAATIGSSTVATIPAATVTGAVTSQTIAGSVVAAGNDQGKLGTLYIAAVLPTSAGGGVFLKNSSGSWIAYNPANPAYYASPVTMGSHSLDVVSALDLSGIVGTKIYAGYGLGTTDFGVATPWNNMLSAGSYNLIYTVAQ